MFKSIFNTITAIAFLFLSSSLSFSDPINNYIENLVPGMNAIGTERSANLLVYFTQDMNASTVNSQTIAMTGSFSGKINISVSYDPAEKKAIINPDTDLKIGEKATIVLTDDIITASNVRITPFQYSFTAKCERGNGNLTKRTIVPQREYHTYGNCLNGDIDKDGDLDIMYPSSFNNYGLLYTGHITYKNAGGNFSLYSIDPIFPAGGETQCAKIFHSDINRDGFLDLVIWSDGMLWQYYWCSNNGSGGFGGPGYIHFYEPGAGGLEPSPMVDIDNDGDEDMAYTIYTQPRGLMIMVNEGSNFSEMPVSGSDSLLITEGDFDNDGDVDLAGLNNANTILFNEGGFSFQRISWLFDPQYDHISNIAEDLDLDGDVDLFLVSAVQCMIYLNNGNGTFTSGPVYQNFVPALAADFDADGDLDIYTENNRIYFNGGDGTFDFFNTVVVGGISKIAGDMNSDGAIDIVSVEHNGEVNLYANEPVNTQLCLIEGPEHVPAGADPILYKSSCEEGFWTLSNYDNALAAIVSANENDSVYVVAGNNYGHFVLYFQRIDTILSVKHVYIDNPLPVRLVSFGYTVSGSSIILNWKTATEENNSGFEVQRSFKGSEFFTLAFLKGHGNSTAPHEYSYSDKNLSSGTYMYRLKQTDFNGNFEYLELSGAVTIGIPDKFFVDQNYPNPFNPVTTISFGIPEAGNVKLKVFDMSGREVRMLINEPKDAGYYTLKFDAGGLASGAYFYRIEFGKYVSVKKMVYLK